MSRPRPGALALLALVVVAAFLASAAPSAAQAAVQASPPDDRRRGVVHDGLSRPVRGACGRKFELAHRDRVAGNTVTLCTHGPDPAPDGVDVARRRPTAELAAAAATAAAIPPVDGPGMPQAQAGIPCYGSGTDGYRVHVIYARASDVADSYAALASSLVQWSAAADQVVSASAAETGGVRHFRFVTDANCNLVVDRVTLSTTGDDNISNTVADLRARGYTRTDRKYLVYVDANVYCGIGQLYGDDSPSAVPGANYNNGHAQAPGMVARVDQGCWGRSGESIEAHELMHNLGGVQDTAPHVTPNSHCTDESDRMCYADAAGVTMQFLCPSSHENRFDCNHDDYFSTNPTPGSYLATHWNTANSAFLATTQAFVHRVWGWNVYNQLGDGTTTGRTTAVVNGLPGVESVAAGGYHSLALASGTVWSWGLGHVGQLGRVAFTSTTPALVPGLSGVTALSGGLYHSVALKADGTVWSWGWNSSGQLGDGTTVDRSAPVKANGLTGVVAVAAGATHTLALKADGTVWSWGGSTVGQLGRTAPAVSPTPAAVPGLAGITSIATGAYHGLAVQPGGTVAAWGYNAWGQVGDGAFVDRFTPVVVTGLTGVQSVGAGIGHSLAVGTDGGVRSWGLGHVGQLGRPIGLAQMSPTAAPIPGLSGVSRVAGAGYHSLALQSGAVAAWGWNYWGQLGDGTLVDRWSPVTASGLVSVISLSGGVGHNLATG